MSIEITIQQRLDMEEEAKIRILMDRVNEYIDHHAQKILGLSPERRNTKLCKSLTTGEKCEHKVCYFAHSLEELKKTRCNFGMNCYLVSKTSLNGYDNCNHKICRYIHPNESNESYARRLGIEYKLVLQVPHEIFIETLELLSLRNLKNFSLSALPNNCHLVKVPKFLQDNISNFLKEKNLTEYKL